MPGNSKPGTISCPSPRVVSVTSDRDGVKSSSQASIRRARAYPEKPSTVSQTKTGNIPAEL